MIKVGKYEIDDSKSMGKVIYHTTCPACPEAGKTNLKDIPLSVNSHLQVFKCHKCGWSGTYKQRENNENYKAVEKIEYTKPTLPNITKLSEEHVKYFFKRGISQQTLKRNKIFTGFYKGTETFNDWINFTYFEGEEPINVKSRASKEKKFMQVSGANHIMYKLNDIRGQKEIIVCEGEIDCFSWEEAGFKNSTSVSQGAPNVNDVNIEKKLACIYNCFDVFEEAKIIYIGVDADVNGRRLQKELIRIFGEEKVKIIDYSVYTRFNGEVCKDANDVLQLEKGKEKLQEAFANAKEIQKEGVYCANDFVEEMIQNYKYGQPVGSTTHAPIDEFYTHRKGEVCLWTGYNNDGKSQFLRYLLILKSKYDGWKHGLYVPEDMPLQEFYTDIVETYQGRTADQRYSNSSNFMSEAQLMQGIEFANKYFFTIFPEKAKSLEELLSRFSYLIRKHNLDDIVLDPYNQIEHLIANNQREDLYISKFMSILKQFAVKNNIVLHLVAHQVTPKKLQNGKFPRPERYSIKGGGTFSDKADNVLVLWRENRFEKGDTAATFISDKIKKRKLTGITGEVSLNFDIRKNRYIFDNGFDPLEAATKINENENVWKDIPDSVFKPNPSFEFIENLSKEEDLRTDSIFKNDLPF